MKDLVFKSDLPYLKDDALEAEFNKIVSNGGEAIYTVVTISDTSYGLGTPLTQFKSLKLAKKYFAKDFKKIADLWLKDARYDDEAIQELKDESEYYMSLEDNYALLNLGDDHLHMYITVSEVHSSLDEEEVYEHTCPNDCKGFIADSNLRDGEYCVKHCSSEILRSIIGEGDMLDVFNSELNHTHCCHCGNLLLPNDSFIRLEFSKHEEAKDYCNSTCLDQDIYDHTEELVLD